MIEAGLNVALPCMSMYTLIKKREHSYLRRCFLHSCTFSVGDETVQHSSSKVQLK